MKGYSVPPLDSVAAVILAGGQGTRLFPLTRARCKPAVRFGGRYRLIDIPISNALNAGIRHISIISQYFASHLNQYILATYQPDCFPSREFQLLFQEATTAQPPYFKGTADAIRQNLPCLLKTPCDYFLILSGDQLYNFDFRAMIAFAKNKDADLVIASLPVYEPEARRMGLLQLDANQKIRSFFEKPRDPQILQNYLLPNSDKYLGSMGIYIFKRSALVSLLQEKGDDFGSHLIPLQVARGRAFSYVFNGYWEDIGTVASYYHANLALTSQKNCLDFHNIYTQQPSLPMAQIVGTSVEQSIIGQGCLIEAKEIFHSIVGSQAKIGEGTVIRGAVVLGKGDLLQSSHAPSIGTNCHIENAILDEDTHLGNHVRLLNQMQLQYYDGDGVFIRDGIIIVTSGTSLPDGFTL